MKQSFRFQNHVTMYTLQTHKSKQASQFVKSTRMKNKEKDLTNAWQSQNWTKWEI